MAHVGTFQLSDSLRQRITSRNFDPQAAAAEIGAEVARELANRSAEMNESLSNFVEQTPEVRRMYGTNDAIEMLRAEEYTEPTTKKISAGYEIDFPMNRYVAAAGWSRLTEELGGPSAVREIETQVEAMAIGYQKALTRNFVRAMFKDTNITTYTDTLGDGTVLPRIVRFLNADGLAIPVGPNGETFNAATHTHYTARAAALANGDIDALVLNVTEHGDAGGLMLCVNVNDAAAVAALTNFLGLTSTHFVSALAGRTDIQLTGEEDPGNMMYGYWNGLVPVWIKPWVPQNYILAIATNARKSPVVMRVPGVPALNGYRLFTADGTNGSTLRSRMAEAFFGFGVWGRTNGAVLYIGDTTWANPVLPEPSPEQPFDPEG